MWPRERYLREGPLEFGDADLLALVLETGCAGRTARQIAEDVFELARERGGIAELPVEALAGVKGVGAARSVRVHAALTLGRRLQTPPVTEPVTCAEAAFQHFRPRLSALAQEELHGLFLNRRHAVLAYRVLTRGNDAHTIVDPRQVYRVALTTGASGVIVAHNHPSGDPTPSLSDVEVTQRLNAAGKVLGVELLDHLVIGGDSWRSLREDGLLGSRTPATGLVAS